MSYLVLARKYRPKNFAEMMGQEHVLRALQNALTMERLHHAYLFTGTRGVGKTTVARIFAKCLNCEHGVSPTPCNECPTCLEIDQGRHLDLLEIDAASRTKVEDTRELLENVQYSPQRGRYKIYLIDEVHMLSGHSFNALLKTLEEPPPHVKFLLATTDPQRLPVTILSRCLQFHLKNMLPAQIVNQLTIILQQEQIAFEEQALALIAKAAQGSMRDALSLLDQTISFSDGKITSNSVNSMLGLTQQQHIIELVSLLAKQQAPELLKRVDELAELGADFLAVLDATLELLQQIAVAKVLNNADETIKELVTILPTEDVQLYYQIGLLGKRDLPLAPDAKSGFMMIMIRMLAFTPNAITTAAPNITKSKVTAPITQPTEKKIATTNAWHDIVTQLNLTGIAQLLAQNCTLQAISDTQVSLTLDESQAALLTPAAKERLNKALQEYYGKPCQTDISIGKSATESPAKLQQREKQEKIQQAEASLLEDKNIQSLMEKFSATLHTDSIVPNDS